MRQCLLFGEESVFLQNYNLIHYLEEKGIFQIVGVTFSNAGFSVLYSDILGYRNIPLTDFVYQESWYVIVMEKGERLHQIVRLMEDAGISDKKIIPYQVLSVCGLDMEQYLELKDAPPTIFAKNCMGGFLYNRLGLKFMSPFINMFMSVPDYLCFLKAPAEYMQMELIHLRDAYEENLKRDYPVCSLGGLELHFNHYLSYGEAKSAWDKRKSRIQWDRLIVLMYTEEPLWAKEFTELPYEKKVCFVPFYTEEPSLHYVNTENSKVPFFKVINSLATDNPYLDIVELLLNGRVRRISQNAVVKGGRNT